MGRLLILLLLVASPAAAQPAIDTAARDALRWSDEREVADWISTGLVAAALVLPCVDDRTWRCAGTEALQLGLGLAASELTKRTVARERPDASDRLSFFSAHTMLACVGTVRSKAWAICPAVGWLRIASDKHWLSDVATGAGVGALLTTIQW